MNSVPDVTVSQPCCKEEQQSIASEIVSDVSLSQPCCNCGVRVEKIFLCSKCNTSKYCSKECQKGQWSAHKALCYAICELSKRGN